MLCQRSVFASGGSSLAGRDLPYFDDRVRDNQPRDRADSVAGAWSNNLRFSDRQFVLYAAVRGEASLVVRR